jgi:GT2 family glycosyltransferase
MCVISVIVPAYQARSDIHRSLGSLRGQDLTEPYEVIAVVSGTDDSADHVANTYPEVRLIRSERRLHPAEASNLGARAAQGRYLAFLPADCVAAPDWLRLRIAKHREGFDAVGGAVTNGTPLHPVGCAGYFLEYSALIPSDRTLREQPIPHSLSYRRELFQRLGGFPEELGPGEDTLLGARCRDEGVAIGFDAAIRLAHRNPTGLSAYLRHQYEHGRGLSRCIARQPEVFGGWGATPGTPAWRAFGWTFLRYPCRRWLSALVRIARARPRWVPAYLLLAPLVWAGVGAAVLGSWRERRVLRAEQARPGAGGRSA